MSGNGMGYLKTPLEIAQHDQIQELALEIHRMQHRARGRDREIRQLVLTTSDQRSVIEGQLKKILELKSE